MGTVSDQLSVSPELVGLKSASEFLPLLYVGKNLLRRELLFSVTPRRSGTRTLLSWQLDNLWLHLTFSLEAALSISEV